MRLLLVAPTIDQDDVGEARSAYEWVTRLSARHEVTVLTYSKRGKRRPSEQLNARVLEWNDLPIVGRFERFNSVLKPGYVAFAARARRAIAGLIAAGERFDVGHQLAPLALRYASPLRRAGIPYLVGPLGGSLETPEPFRGEFGSEPWYVRFRAFDKLRIRHDPALRATYANAEVVLGVGRYVRDLLEAVPLKRFEIMSETGVDSVKPASSSRPDPRRGVRLLHVGRLVRSKGLRDALRALALVAGDRSWRLDIIGDGPEREPCESIARESGIGDRVSFHGRLPRAEIDPFYASTHVFLFPSFREPSGNVVIEAMSHGLACIVADRGGPASAVGDGAGTRVPVTDPPGYARALADAIKLYLDDPALIERHGAGASEQCSARFVWDRKIEQIESLYEQVARTSRERAPA